MQALPGPVKCLRAPLGHISFLLALTHLRLQFLLLLEAPSSMAASPSAKVYSENPVGSKLNASVLRGKATPFWTGCWEDQRRVKERRVRRAESQEKKMGVHSWKHTHKHDYIYAASHKLIGSASPRKRICAKTCSQASVAKPRMSAFLAWIFFSITRALCWLSH